MSKCIACGKREVTWPLVCDDCRDKEAQAVLSAGGAEECVHCGMLYDGGMRCTYCGSLDPTDSGEFDDDDDFPEDRCTHGIPFDEECEDCELIAVQEEEAADERERRHVTREMALDAGDPDLEGQPL